MGVIVEAVGWGLPGENVPGRIVTNKLLEEEMLAERAKLVAAGLILTPDEWGNLDEEELETAQARWKQFEMEPQWLVDNTGIEERRYADEAVATSDLALAAVENCCANAAFDVSLIDGLQLATVTPDHRQTPPTVALIQKKLNLPVADEDKRLRNFFGIDLTLACTSFVTALQIGWMGMYSRVMSNTVVVGADKMTGTFDPLNRSLSGILADGAGALKLAWDDSPDNDAFPYGPRSFMAGVDGSKSDLIITPRGGSASPMTADDFSDVWQADRYMTMQGPFVKKWAVRYINKLIPAALERVNLSLGDIDFIAFHQANPARINKPVEESLRAQGFRGICPHNGQRYGNTTSGSIPLVLADAWREGVLEPGMTVLIVAFGGGFSWGSIIMHWTAEPYQT